MILIDSNVPMYLVGAAHPHKEDAQRALERLIEASEQLVTDAEVLQEFVLGSPMSARDALHLAVMEQHGVERILSFDRDFDHIQGIVRLSA